MSEIKVVTDRESLSSQCEKATLEEGSAIASRLIKVLIERSDGIGLAANQIGIQKQVCVVNVVNPVILVNPVVIKAQGTVDFLEGCLSFPGEGVITERYDSIDVMADNHKDVLHFSKDKNLLECVCIQHEIDHLNGITMHDRRKQ
jgi:peptide deformylase